MKKTYLKTLRSFTVCMLAMCAISCFTSCSKDNEPGDGDKGDVTDVVTFKGDMVTSLPSMTNFPPVVTENEVTVKYENKEHTSATLELSAFTLSFESPMGPMKYDIPTISVSNVKCETVRDVTTFTQPEFKCVAAEYEITGSLAGTLENGKLKMTLQYTPGAMPIPVVSVFESK